MKPLTMHFIFSIIILFTACAQREDFSKISESEVDQARKAFAETFAHEFYTNLKNGQANDLGAEVTDDMKKVLTTEKQKALYGQLSSQIGHYESLQYAETWIMNAAPGMQIYRFKGKFEDDPKYQEIRVVMNEDGQVAGFFIKPWLDPLS